MTADFGDPGKVLSPLCASSPSLALCLHPESQNDLGRDLKVQLTPSPGVFPEFGCSGELIPGRMLGMEEE